MNDKQIAILDGLVRMEEALNKMLRDATEEGLPMNLIVHRGKLHFTVDQVEFEFRQLISKMMPNDD